MRLDKLEIRGFKSFRDKTALEFPDQFTAIVGPNGSGKSNIIDSICFVLGRSRGLRANNISELICNGGIDSKESDYARVSMYLSDGNKNQIKITREIDRTGKSIYKLNNKRSSRQEIEDIVGDNEYNIILQDDVTRIIDMKPKERRQIIDNLCGIGEYDKKKEKALHELEKVEARISETNIILGEKQGYLEELGKERDEAIRYQDLQNVLKSSRATILHLEIKDHENREKRINERIEKLRLEKEQNSNRINEIKAEVSEKNNKLKEINSEVLRLEEEKGSTKLVELRGEITRGQDKLDNLNNSLQDLKDKISEKKKKKQALIKERETIDSELEKISKKITPLLEKIKEESKKISSLEIDKDMDKLKTEIFDLRSRIATSTEIGKRDMSEIKNLQDEKSYSEGKIKELLKEEKGIAIDIDNNLMTNRSNFDEYERLKSERPELNQRYKNICKELKEMQIKFAEKNAELKTLEKTTSGLNNAITAVMNLKKVIPGIYGTVSQLGNISNPEYEKALQISAGSRMQNIVVENEDTATKCIEYLRKKEIGRATFLPLNKINVKISEKSPKEAIGFIRDFITTPEKFEKIFTYVYGDTLLVENINKARKIGIGKWRMITLDGDLLSRGGAMTGGYLREVAIRFSPTDELEKGIKDIETKIIKLDGERQELELRIKKVEDKLSELEDSVSSGKTDIEKIRLEKEALGKKRKELQQRTNELDIRINNLKKKIYDDNEVVKKIKQDLEINEKKLEKLMGKGPKIDTTILEKLREGKHQLEIEQNRLEEKSSLILDQINDITKELQGLGKEHKEIDENFEKIKESISKLETKLIIQEEENVQLIDNIEKLINQRSKMEEEITELSNENGRAEFEFERINEKINKQEIEKAKIETRFSDLKKEFTSYSNVGLMEDKNLKELEEMVMNIENQLQEFGSVNMRAIESYEILKKEFEDITGKLETLKNERQSIFDFMEKVEQKKRETFMKTFEVVKKNFEKIFKEISDGEGTLLLDNPREISESGLLITASPKGKKLLNLDAMSGGEKVLTSAAFLLAIQQYKPSYFYIVDELDAMLDKENSLKLAEMLKKSDAQFMLVTHNDNIIKYAHSVIGVSMNKGISQIVGVKLT